MPKARLVEAYARARNMAACCKCLGPQLPTNLSFANTMGTAIGDRSIPEKRRLYLGVFFPADLNVQPVYMFYSLSNEGTKVLDSACAAAGLKMDRGRLVGSPERLNLFTLEGDLLRLDLDLEAHIPSTLQPNSCVILEKGNRVSPERLSAVREAAVAAMSEGVCAIM